jgi:hypothetical protein
LAMDMTYSGFYIYSSFKRVIVSLSSIRLGFPRVNGIESPL